MPESTYEPHLIVPPSGSTLNPETLDSADPLVVTPTGGSTRSYTMPVETDDAASQAKGKLAGTAAQAKEKLAGAASQAKDKLAGVASQAQDRINELGRTTGAALDDKRPAAADALHNTASGLRSTVATSGEAITRFAHTAADQIERTADYVRGKDSREMLSDAELLVRRSPLLSLAGALALGFLVGTWLRRD